MKAEVDRRDSFQSYIYKQRPFVVNEEVVKVELMFTKNKGRKEGRARRSLK